MKESPNILVVDDEQAHTIALTDLLKKAGYQVASANDGFKAIAACKVKLPDIIVLDLHMPLIGGVEVFNRLRADERTANIPIIFLGSRDQTLQDLKTPSDMEDVLFKPFEPQELLSRVKSVLREKTLRDELRAKEQQLRELSLTDPLTELKTARYLNEFLKTGIRQSKRYKVPLSIVVVEVDQYKELNRAIGREECDAVINKLAKMIDQQMRDSDIVVRTAEFEFTVVLTCTNSTGAIEVAERLRTKIQDTPFDANNMELNITVSVGICQWGDKMDEDGKVLMAHARAALQQGHNSGGNVTLMAQ
ncbi:MAG TPA: diguanylate cyclase [Candidatus Melainabacteria bacterium]|nr:diguanylate cyclase [Candidatus Melainabacteria bacterium]HIN64386.1 diguanylate cyclase [Candidatus Obscuribacterales bacterium]